MIHDHLYFAYGSNLRSTQMNTICPGHRFVSTACLRGYRLAFTLPDEEWQGGVADLAAHDGSEVWGALYALTASHLVALDAYEGFDPAGTTSGNLYVRRAVEVTAANGHKVRDVWTYFVRQPRSHVEPSPIYRKALLAGAQERGLPASHIEAMQIAFTRPPSGQAATAPS